MSGKIERVVRTGALSPEEGARDIEIRRKVEHEFPSAMPGPGPTGRLTRLLKDALRASNRYLDDIARQARIAPKLLSSFLAGKRDIPLSTADRLAEALGLKLASTR